MAIIPSPPRVPALVSFLPDTVGVFDQDYNPLFKDARPMEELITPDSKVMEHPLETGNILTDHTIILPIEIEMIFILPVGFYYNTYETINQLFLNRTIVIVQTKAAVYTNMYIKSIPRRETADMYNRISLSIRFREAQFAPVSQSIVTAPTNPTNSDTIQRGAQNAMPIPEEIENISSLRTLVNPFL